MGDPTGEVDKGALRLDFDRRLLLQFRGSAITSGAGLLPYRELDDTLGLTDMGANTLADARTGKNGRHRLAGLLRQSVFGRLAGYEDVTYGKQEGSAYNGHFGCTCYHPLFVFNQFGDVERSALRPGNIHSADGWRVVLEPVVARYRETVKRLYFRGDAAYSHPEIYGFLEAEGIGYTIRLPANSVLAYNPGNFMRTLAMPQATESWSLTSLREKLIKIGAKVVSHGRYVTFQMAEVAVSRQMFFDILSLIARLRAPPTPA